MLMDRMVDCRMVCMLKTVFNKEIRELIKTAEEHAVPANTHPHVSKTCRADLD